MLHRFPAGAAFALALLPSVADTAVASDPSAPTPGSIAPAPPASKSLRPLGAGHGAWGSPVALAASPDGEAEAALGAGRRALEQGRYAAAKGHLERAAAGASTRLEALELYAQGALAEGDPDGVARAALAWAEATTGPDGRGTARSPRGAFLVGDGGLDAAALGLSVASARIKAADALSSFAAERQGKGSRSPGQLLTAAWARRFGLDLVDRSPLALRGMARELSPYVSAPASAHGAVLKGVERIGEKALSGGRPGIAARAGRILHGLAVQADFKDLRGDRPTGMARWRSKGASMMDRARERLAAGEETPWTVEELEWLATDEGEAFTRAHGDFADPGVAVSPRGWYRVESDCGYETLLGVASTIESHHTRLVDYFGEDPFTEGELRQGLIRIVPDPSGLEAEGAPFFWVGGFQGGDVTVVRHSVGTIVGLGRTLTHELTHRFDGALHGGIPPWLAEGRAVWTGAAYRQIADEAFAPRWCAFGSMRTTRNRGYSSKESLEKLIRGEPEDYRQNYSAGNALYVFLSTWFEGDAPSMDAGRPVFRERLVEFENRGKHPSKPAERFEEFVETFCDGKDGRPAGFDAFQEHFQAFVGGFDVRRPAEFTKRYVGRFADAERGEWTYDEPTWTWDWQRAEPVFGQNQARTAGEFLWEQGDTANALKALVWARSVDGYDFRTADTLAAIFSSLKKPKNVDREALWAVAHEKAGEPHESATGGTSPGAFPTTISAVTKYLEVLGEASASLRNAGAGAAAAALESDARRVSAWLGLGLPPEGPGVEPARSWARELGGWEEEELTGLDEERRPGLYSIEEDRGLLLGRKERRGGTGRVDRRGGGKSFVRADRWMLPGAYSITTNVRFTTGFNTAVAVVGWTSRERGIRIHLTAGDYDYAIGEDDEEPAFESVRWRFRGMRTRDAGLNGSARGGTRDLGTSSTSVKLELIVEGAAVSAWISGEYVGTYHTIDGAPIEGYVGFGTAQGAVRLTAPVVRRMDGEAPEGRDAGSVLDLARGTGPRFDALRNRRVRLGEGRPSASNGTLVLWIPATSKADQLRGKKEPEEILRSGISRARKTAGTLLERLRRNDIIQPLVVAVPASFRGSLDLADWLGEMAEEAPEGAAPPSVVFHAVGVNAGPAAPDAAVGADPEEALDENRRWVLFLDAANVVRARASWVGGSVVNDPALQHWLTVFRDHGRPQRVLPELVRGAELGEDEGDDD